MLDSRKESLEQRKKKHNLTVIKGGCPAPTDHTERRFVSAFVTDTRLMGVVGLYIHWEIESPDFISDFHQFFYYDAEEYGLETYKSCLGSDPTVISAIESAMMGGLGGQRVELNEQEARYLVKRFAEGTKRLKAPLPEGQSEFQFILKEPVSLTDEERERVDRKQCTKLSSPEQLIHYFLMRCFGKDQEGMELLTADGASIEAIGENKAATLCKNTVDEFFDDGSFSYLCESLIEVDDRYKMVISEITLSGKKVTSAHRRSAFSITPAEASMQLSRPEYITVYEILEDPDEFDAAFLPQMAPCMQTLYDSGRLFMEFNRNNDHVNRRIFQLNEDIHGLYYVTDFGQLLIAAYDLVSIREVENGLAKGPVGPILLPAAKYEFKEPILYEFIQSGFDDFTDFLETLQ